MSKLRQNRREQWSVTPSIMIGDRLEFRTAQSIKADYSALLDSQ
jgi:hypothetical protein